MALPRDNLFYGWAAGGVQSIRTVEDVGVFKAPFDIYASGHSILSPKYQSENSNAVFDFTQ